MEFLVEIEISWPPDGDAAQRSRLVEAETRRSAELAEAGRLLRLWREPGRWANVGLWSAADATELHEALSSLPLFPWMHIRVRALARHPSDPAA